MGGGGGLRRRLIGAAAVTLATALFLIGFPTVAGAALVVGGVGAALMARQPDAARVLSVPLEIGADFSLVGSALGLIRDPAALTDGEGALLVVNAGYRQRFGNRVATGARRRRRRGRPPGH